MAKRLTEKQKKAIIQNFIDGNTLDFLKHSYSNLNDNGIAVFHEAFNNSWLGFKKRSDWAGIPTKFNRLMESYGFAVEKFERVKFYGPSKSHVVALLRKK